MLRGAQVGNLHWRSWIFSYDFGQKFLPSLCMANMKLEMMFGDVSECFEGHLDHIWTFSVYKLF